MCGQETGMSDAQYWKGFSVKISDRRIPFSGSLALTYRCNLGCIHCYSREEQLAELNIEQWKKIIGEIKEAGCLYLLLTGGEPLLREDFSELYAFIKKSGFLATVFTNGTRITDRIVELFREYPPRLVEISMYGASAETHDRVTGVPGSFARSLQGIETLIGNDIHVGLKSILMTQNLDEFSAIRDLAQTFGVKFRLDAAIFPTLAGDRPWPWKWPIRNWPGNGVIFLIASRSSRSGKKPSPATREEPPFTSIPMDICIHV
jgi:MoaA/NifB/PqqE/SkfB family radical SAM enzyme